MVADVSDGGDRDIDLALAAKAGDMAALETLYMRYAPFVLNQARRYGAGDDAEDVVQTIFTELAEDAGWHVRPEATPADGTLFNFLTPTTQHATIHQRAGWRRKYHGEYPKNDIEVVPLWAWRTESPEDRTLRLERTKRLSAALASLPQRLRQVARLRFVECLSGPEIAERLGLSKRSIPQYLFDIRERLRPALAVVYRLPPRGRYGHMRIDHRSDRALTASQINLNARRRRERALARKRGEVPR